MMAAGKDAAEAHVISTTMLWLTRLLFNGFGRIVGLVPRLTRLSWHRVRDFEVIVSNTRPDIRTADALKRLGEALALIARYQPIRYTHLVRDVEFFLIKREAHRGHYQVRQRAIVTELTFLARKDISAAVVASSILHEAVHARTHALARNMAGHHPGREERICRKAELQFGEALPSPLGEPVIERAQAILALEDDELWVRTTDRERVAAIAEADSRLRRGAS